MDKKKYRIVVFTLPSHGHINPMLAILTELVNQGHKVVVYNIEEFRQKIELTGAEFRCAPVPLEKVYLHVSKDLLAMAYAALIVTEKVTQPIINELKNEKPDLIIHDSITLWGKLVAQGLNVPAISVITTVVITRSVFFSHFFMALSEYWNFALHPIKLFQILQLYQKLLDRYHAVHQDMFDFVINKEDINLVFTSRLFQPKQQQFSLENFKFIGPSIIGRKEDNAIMEMLDSNKKIIYISMGTIYYERPEFFKMCISAFKDSEYQVVMSIGEVNPATIGVVPLNFIVEKFVPQIQLLERADIFITHAGMNSITESVLHEVPMILIPQIHEQRLNALRAAQLKVGIYLEKKTLTTSALKDITEKMLADKDHFKAPLRNLKRSFIEAGGYRKGVEIILEYIQKQPPRVV